MEPSPTPSDLNTLLLRPLALPVGVFPHRPGQSLVTADGHRLSADERLDLVATVNRFD